MQEHNRCFQPPRSKEKKSQWTENQRDMASKAVEPSSLDDLKTQVSYTLFAADVTGT